MHRPSFSATPSSPSPSPINRGKCEATKESSERRSEHKGVVQSGSCSAAQHSTVQQAQHSATQHSKHRTAKHSTASTGQQSTVQHSIVQQAQRSAAQHSKPAQLYYFQPQQQEEIQGRFTPSPSQSQAPLATSDQVLHSPKRNRSGTPQILSNSSSRCPQWTRET